MVMEPMPITVEQSYREYERLLSVGLLRLPAETGCPR